MVKKLVDIMDDDVAEKRDKCKYLLRIIDAMRTGLPCFPKKLRPPFEAGFNELCAYLNWLCGWLDDLYMELKFAREVEDDEN